MLVIVACLLPCCADSHIRSIKYRRPAYASCWKRYRPAKTVKLTPEMLKKDTILLLAEYGDRCAVYHLGNRIGQSCRVPPKVMLHVDWPHAWWLEAETAYLPRGPSGSSRISAMRKAFYQNLQTGHRHVLTGFPPDLILIPHALADEVFLPWGKFYCDTFVAWDPAEKRYRWLDGPSGEWHNIPDSESLPQSQAVVSVKRTGASITELVLGPQAYCIMIPNRPSPREFIYSKAKRTWIENATVPLGMLRRNTERKPVRYAGSVWTWRSAPFGPILCRSESRKGSKVLTRSIPVTDGYPPQRLLPEIYHPIPASDSQLEKLRRALPAGFESHQRLLFNVTDGTRIWGIWTSGIIRENESLPERAMRLSASVVFDSTSEHLDFLTQSDLQPFGRPIRPIAIYRGYLFACEHFRAPRPSGSKFISFLLIRTPQGKWKRIESIGGWYFGIRGEYAYAILPGQRRLNWLHRCSVRELLRNYFPSLSRGVVAER